MLHVPVLWFSSCEFQFPCPPFVLTPLPQVPNLCHTYYPGIALGGSWTKNPIVRKTVITSWSGSKPFWQKWFFPSMRSLVFHKATMSLKRINHTRWWQISHATFSKLAMGSPWREQTFCWNLAWACPCHVPTIVLGRTSALGLVTTQLGRVMCMSVWWRFGAIDARCSPRCMKTMTLNPK